MQIYTSSEEIEKLIHINLYDRNLIKHLFKKELKIFDSLNHSYSLFDAYQFSFELKRARQEERRKWFIPLLYPSFLYVLAWLLLLSLSLIMIPQLKTQMSQLDISFPSHTITFLFGIQIGLFLIILFGSKSITLNQFDEFFSQSTSKLKSNLRLYLTYLFINDLHFLLKRNIDFINALKLLRMHPNKYLGHLIKKSYNHIKEGHSLQESLNSFDSTFSTFLLIDQTSIQNQRFDHMIKLYRSILNHKFKFIKQSIQFIAYSLILISVILSYQIVLLPLKLLEELI